ncbi:MAG: alpha/beta fold hydrolase, partial [Myxococcota bacterium]|nr:alpha/beta fold hydrolase [Myxococcota bacterium]
MISWVLIVTATVTLLTMGTVIVASRALRRHDATSRGRPDQVDEVETADGWHLQLSRYQGTGVPVIVCHGIASSGRNLDLSVGRSIVRSLHARGHDVWRLDLRGCGGSRQGPEDAPGITFDDFVRHDGPAAIAHVCEVTGQDAVDWVGFSMGGIIGTALLGEPCGGGMRTLTIIGAPMKMRAGSAFSRLARVGVGLFRRRGAVPLRVLSRLGAHLPSWVVAPFLRLLINPKNVAWTPMRLAMDQSVEDIPTGVLDQMTGWHENEGGHVGSGDHGIDYVRRLEDAPPIPLLCISGTGDRLGPVMATVPALAHHRGPRFLRVIGRGALKQVERWTPQGVTAQARELP